MAFLECGGVWQTSWWQLINVKTYQCINWEGTCKDCQIYWKGGKESHKHFMQQSYMVIFVVGRTVEGIETGSMNVGEYVCHQGYFSVAIVREKTPIYTKLRRKRILFIKETKTVNGQLESGLNNSKSLLLHQLSYQLLIYNELPPKLSGWENKHTACDCVGQYLVWLDGHFLSQLTSTFGHGSIVTQLGGFTSWSLLAVSWSYSNVGATCPASRKLISVLVTWLWQGTKSKSRILESIRLKIRLGTGPLIFMTNSMWKKVTSLAEIDGVEEIESCWLWELWSNII